MTPERWMRLTELFDSALNREPEERAAFLAATCADDPTLRREVEQLLESDERAGSFGDSAAFRFAEPAPHRTLDAGSWLGRYEILGFLAAGGMGEVYRARDPQLGREVGIKILPQGGETSGDQLARFEREARAVGALNHPNILAVYDIGVDHGIPYVVSELLDGETLRAMLTRGPVPVEQSLLLARQIVAGLTAAHDKGIVHRDLKPENLFVTGDGVVKILDFGLAKRTAVAAANAAARAPSLTEHGLVVGTAGYMSPEQVRGRPADGRSDIFAVGAVFYEMLTGARAFTGESPAETMSAILTVQPHRLSDLPAPFDRIVPRCLEKEPARRFASMREVGAAFDAPPLIEPAATGRVVLAVLPFENLGDNEEQEYFSDGLTDEMIAQLGRLNPQRLGVIARTSAMRYKRTQKSVDVIGRELGASYILEGSIRRSANRVRVATQLVQASDQTHLWAQTYDREIGDMLALQSDVARAIASEIQVQLTPEERVRLARVQPVNPAAYEAYLKGRYFWNRRTRDSIEKSVDYFRKAIDIDPRHAAAFAGLADAYLTQLDYNHLRPRDAFALANQAVLEALQLDDTLAEPHTSLGHLRLHQFDWSAAEQQFTRAIELNPGYGTAHYYYANLLAALGRFDEGIVEANRALELDPMSSNTRQNRLFILYLARRYDEALEQVQDTIELDPTYTALHYWLGLVYERQGKYADAIDAFGKLGPTRGNRGLTVLATLGHTHAVAGNRTEATELLNQLEVESTHEYVSSYDLALLHMALGNKDRACALLSKAYDHHSSFLPFLGVDARWDPLRTDPRFQALVHKMNFPPGRPDRHESDRELPRARVRSIAAILLFVAGITAAGLFISGRQQPPGPGASGRPALAVMSFDDHSGDSDMTWLASGLPSMLVTSLAQTPGLDVIGSERLEASLRELGRDAADPSARGDVARHAGAGAVLLGGLFKVGNDIRIDVRLEDVETGRIVTASTKQGPDVFVLVDALAADIRTALDLADRPAGRPLRDVTTTSLPAYELYIKGMDAVRNVRNADARTLLEEAVRIDPTFAVARTQLALVLERLGEPIEAQTHRRTMMGQLDRLSDRQRLLVEAKQEFSSDASRAREIAERLLARYPDEEEAYDLIIHTYTYTRDPAHWKDALGFMQRWARAIPGPGSGHFHNHYGYILIDNGLYAEAEKEFRAYLRVSPNEANPYDSLAELFLLTGRPREAIEQYEQALRRNPMFGGSYVGLAYAHAMLGQYDEAMAAASTLHKLGPRAGLSAATIHLANAFICSRLGRYREAEDHIATAGRFARELGDTGAETDSHLLEALVTLERRRPEKAGEVLRWVWNTAPRRAVDVMWTRRFAFAHLMHGTAEVYGGRVDAARAHHLAQRDLGPGNDEFQRAWQQGLAGEMALASGNVAEAESAFRAAVYQIPPSISIHTILVTVANHPPFRDGLARAKAARGELHEAIEMYRELNEPDIASKWTAVLEPRFLLAIARLADRAGDRNTARAEYARFLDLWKDADEGLPELLEARRYLRRPA